MLTNSLINAAKFTGHGGEIWLTVERTAGVVVIRVRDTGIGIEPELLGKLFDLFVQGERRLDPYRTGVGIGLNLVKEPRRIAWWNHHGPQSGSEHGK